MSVDEPFNIYREQLSSHYHGLALWDPNPVENLHEEPGHVSIGDVGYLDNGAFMRMFNVTLTWDDPSNKLIREPEKYERINPSHFDNRDVRGCQIREGAYYTRVSKVDNLDANRHEDSLGQMYQCSAQHRGALLYLPHEGQRKDVIPLQVFKNYIRDNVDKWFRWSEKMNLPVEHMEDLILVTGCTLVSSWAAAAFDGHMSVDSNPTTISLEARTSDGGRAQYFWRNIRGSVEYHNSPFDPNVRQPLPQNQCVFIRGFRAKRRLFRPIIMRAAAEPLPDDPDNSREDEIQVTRIPDSSKYRDPLVGVLDYIIQKISEDIIAIVHDDDLRFIEGVETLTASAIEKSLDENQLPLIIKNGCAFLCDLTHNSSTSPSPGKSRNPSSSIPPHPTPLSPSVSYHLSSLSSPADSAKSPHNMVVDTPVFHDLNPESKLLTQTHPGSITIYGKVQPAVTASSSYPHENKFWWKTRPGPSSVYPWSIYHEQMSTLSLGIPLLDPIPCPGPDPLSIGDVGYLHDGGFRRIFNVLLPWDDPSNRLVGIPEQYKPLDTFGFGNVRATFGQLEHHTSHVTSTCDSDGETYQCTSRQGALLYLPHGGSHEVVPRPKVFEDYMKDNVDNWFRWTIKKGLPVNRMEDLILVTERTLVTSWAFAVLDAQFYPAKVTLKVEASDNGGAQYFWHNVRGNVQYHTGPSDPDVQQPLPQNQCVFIRGFRAKRTFLGAIKLKRV